MNTKSTRRRRRKIIFFVLVCFIKRKCRRKEEEEEGGAEEEEEESFCYIGRRSRKSIKELRSFDLSTSSRSVCALADRRPLSCFSPSLFYYLCAMLLAGGGKTGGSTIQSKDEKAGPLSLSLSHRAKALIYIFIYI